MNIQPIEDKLKEESKLATLRRRDLIVASIVWLIALAVFFESWRLSFYLDLPGVGAEKAWLVSPGIFPLILSSALLCMFSAVIWISFHESSIKGYYSKNAVLSFLFDRENLEQIAQVSLLCLFVFGLLGRIHFGIASALYLSVSMFISRAASWYSILLISLIFSISITYLFGSVMKIPLP